MGFFRRKEKESESQPGSVVSATARKESEKVKYGIVFHRKMPNSPTTIKSISSKSVFRREGLEPEMVLLEVNGEEAAWKSPEDLALALKDAPVGSDLSITATLPRTLRMTRDSEETSWGFSIKNSTIREGIYVNIVEEEGLAASSGLKHGMLILNINDGQSFPNNLKEAAEEMRSQGDSIELIVVQLEISVDIDLDVCNEASIEVDLHEVQFQEEARDDIDSENPNKETLPINTESETRDDMNNFPTSGDSQDDFEVVDLDDILFAESRSQAPLVISRIESREGTGKNEKNKPSGWLFKRAKEEQCFDLDDEFPECYTKNNNSLFQSVFPASKNPSKTSEVMSQVMQLQKVKRRIPKHPIEREVSLVESPDAPKRQAWIFGQKRKVSMPTIESFNPQGRPSFFKRTSSVFSVKSQSGKLAKEDERMVATKRVDAFDWILSLQDRVCAPLDSCRGNTVVETDIMSVTSASSRRSMRPLRFRKQRTNKAHAKDLRRREEALDL